MSERKFLGKLMNLSKNERSFEKKHLKGYLKGSKYFRYGFNSITKEPEYYKVLQSYKEHE